MKIAKPYILINKIETEHICLDIVLKDGTNYIVSCTEKIGILSGFFYVWNNLKSIKEDLLPAINDVLISKIDSTDIGADIFGLAYIEKETTKLMGSDVGYADMELPTIEFREIIIKWLEFLENSEV